jgi:hypothetical protein
MASVFSTVFPLLCLACWQQQQWPVRVAVLHMCSPKRGLPCGPLHGLLAMLWRPQTIASEPKPLLQGGFLTGQVQLSGGVRTMLCTQMKQKYLSADA